MIKMVPNEKVGTRLYKKTYSNRNFKIMKPDISGAIKEE